MHCVVELVMCLTGLSERVGRHADGLDRVYDVARRYCDGTMLILCFFNTFNIVCQMHLLSERIGGGWCSEKGRAVFRKEEGSIQKIGGLCSEKRRAVFRK